MSVTIETNHEGETQGCSDVCKSRGLQCNDRTFQDAFDHYGGGRPANGGHETFTCEQTGYGTIWQSPLLECGCSEL